MIRAYEMLLKRLKQNGMELKKQILSNEASEDYIYIIMKNKLTYKKVPSDMHQ